MTHSVEVRIDPTRHATQPGTEIERLQWEVLDTVCGLLGEYAVRIAIQAMREGAAELGLPFSATDQEMFNRDSDAPNSYRDLAPDSPAAEIALADTFRILADRLLDLALAHLKEAGPVRERVAQFYAEVERMTGPGE